MVADLTGLPVAGASLLDESTAAAEAMTLSRRAAGKGSIFLADADCLPQTLAVLATRAEPLGIELVVAPVTAELVAAQPAGELFGVLLPYPGASGRITDPRPAAAAAASRGALVTIAADLLALTLLTPPGELGADIAIGTSQRFGVPMGYGGPHAAYISVREELRRQLPGRLVGVSVDADGHPAYRLALQAREQHIRRERATSNICTAQVLLAVIASLYAAYHGPDGLAAIARQVHGRATALAATLRALDCTVEHSEFFDTVQVTGLPGGGAAAAQRARQAGYNVYLAGPGTVQAACAETTTDADVREVAAALAGRPAAEVTVASAAEALPAGLLRTSGYLSHPVFHEHHSETSMLRYLRRLSDFDIALDRSMIPLGSCTMKLNAAAEMEAISWPEFAGLHPFAPAGQAAGYTALIADLTSWLTEITGYHAVSLQPNAGSQGELAGLLAIRHYHTARGDSARDVCLIPESAHGTNAASAVLAGLRVVVVKCGGDGAVNLTALRSSLATHEGRVAGIMLTYPSTNGVFEETVTEVCALVHGAGGQVYVDGANLNALVGIARPGRFGADVSHLNLHKTFCIPHGGGGPGVGPVAVAAHLAPYLPTAYVPGADADRPGQRHRPGRGRALRLGGHLADLLGLYRDDGRGRAAQGHRRRHPGSQLPGQTALAALPGAAHGAEWAGRPRVHRQPAGDHQGHRGDRGGRRQAADRLRVPRADDVIPGGRHADGRADRERGSGRAGPVLRRDDCHPAGDRAGGRRRVRPHRQPAPQRAAHRVDAAGQRLEAWLRAGTGRLSGADGPPGQVLAAGPPDRLRLR